METNWGHNAVNISQEENHIKLSPCMALYISYLVFLSISDILALALFYLKKNQYIAFAIAAAFLLTVLVVIYFKKSVNIAPLHITKIAWGSILILSIIALTRSVSPDLSHDVIMARVYWQYPGFQDNVNYNVFPAGFTFFFTLADRCFYYPNVLLGYRMGTLFNLFLLLLTYFQTREIFCIVLSGRQKSPNGFSKRFFNVDILTFISVTLYYSITELGTYMVDLAALPLILYLLRIIISKEVFSKKETHFFVAMLLGIVFALKFTNVIFIVPLLLLYLYNQHGKISVWVFLICAFIAFLPASPYLLYAYTSTGNPVYWTFNSIFKSKYYIDENFKDTRWGPSGFWDFILWPIHLIFRYRERVSEISYLPQVYLLLGLLGSFGICIHNFKRRLYLCSQQIIVYYFLFTYICWLASTGYPRYAIICELLAVIITCCWIIQMFDSSRKKNKLFAGVISALVLLQCCLNTSAGILNYGDWAWRPLLPTALENGSFVDNLKWCFRDRGPLGSDEQRKKVDVFCSTFVLHNMMKQINPNAPIINMRYVMYDLASVSEQKGGNFPEHYLSKLKELSSSNRIFDLAWSSQIGEVYQNANMVNARIKNIEYVNGYYLGDKTPLLIEYDFSDERENTYTDLSKTQSYTIDCSKKDSITLSGFAFLDPYVVWRAKPAHLKLYTKTSDGTEHVLYELKLKRRHIYELNETIDLSNYTGMTTIYIEDDSREEDYGMSHVINLSID